MKQPGVKSPQTPLLNAMHQTIDFNADPESLTTPLPLVYALSIPVQWRVTLTKRTVSRTSSPV